MAVNWSLGLAPDVGGMFQQGLEHGQKQAKERLTDQALTAFAQNPNDAGAVNALMRVNPRLGYQIHQDQQKNQKQERIRTLAMKAAQGDHSVMPELLVEAPELWTKLGADQQDKVKRATSFMANAGLQIGQLPEQNRAAAWNQYVQQAEAGGLDIPKEYEQYSPQAFNAAMAEAGKMGEFLDSQKIEWKSVPLGATFVPTNAATGARLDVPQAGGGGGQAVGGADTALTTEQAAPIIQQAQQTGIISRGSANAIIKSLGANGQQAFQQWMQKHNVKVQDDGQSVAPPPGFVLDH